MAGLLSTVRTSVTKSLNNIEPLRKAMSISASQSLFSLISMTQELSTINYSAIPRQQGNFDFEFLISSLPGKPLPPETYDLIVAYVMQQTRLDFIKDGINLIGIDFGNSTLVDDPTTGRVSLVFSINIIATLKR
ncbi:MULTISPECIES: hypothetical protein [Klebsiella/Raoultella group]|uniref:Uncharacterized protein n=1 Tax=Raoultella ornithinolytica TaxID=54291 RepID=A0A9Q9MWH3_RAOOR|nr:hypothetical protein [Raoultella ornithinolytica]MDU4226396.1 hypothetical protein [Klebsiella grimontii]HDT5883439.1 hypothetical protein [Klebsiella pneumoniae subsp. pneumoniae]HDX8798809.1 hypothetical protein [Klebsiella michiganensis]UXE36445.1 hypothetical protein N2J37_18010 [Raoultella ornithinolytica]HDT5929132.1 hypothetical protein [Klebsiella pneumoniae subsp. pneumoniae]